MHSLISFDVGFLGSSKDSEDASKPFLIPKTVTGAVASRSLFSGHTVPLNYHLKKWNTFYMISSVLITFFVKLSNAVFQIFNTIGKHVEKDF